MPAVLLLLAVTVAQTGSMIGLALLLGGAILALQVILYSVAGGLYPSAARGTGIGAAVGVGRIGSIVGPALAALMIGAGRTPVQVLEGLLPIAVLCAVCIAVLALPIKKEGTASG
jgi:AAHS family 3-hydroxyphenylpropionic acid transporter